MTEHIKSKNLLDVVLSAKEPIKELLLSASELISRDNIEDLHDIDVLLADRYVEFLRTGIPDDLNKFLYSVLAFIDSDAGDKLKESGEDGKMYYYRWDHFHDLCAVAIENFDPQIVRRFIDSRRHGWEMLEKLTEKEGGIRHNTFARMLNISAQYLSKLLREFEKHDLVVRQRINKTSMIKIGLNGRSLMSERDREDMTGKISVRRPIKKTIKIGIGVFPDTMILPFGIDEGFFNRLPVRLKVVPLPWNSIFDALFKGEVSMIIGNKSQCGERNKEEEFFKYYNGLHLYNGFAIMVRRDNPTPILSFNEMKDKYKNESNDELVVKTLRQISGLTIIASKGTDHLDDLIKCANKVGLTPNEHFNIISHYEPYEGLKSFLNGVGNAYIGGISQRIIAGKNNMKTLITQELVNVEIAPQENGFITNVESEISEDLTAQIARCWFYSVGAIDRDRGKYVPKILKYLNNQIQTYLGPDYEINENDFDTFWNKWERFPASYKASESMWDDFYRSEPVSR